MIVDVLKSFKSHTDTIGGDCVAWSQDWIFQEKIPASLLCQTLLDASCRDYFVDMKYMERRVVSELIALLDLEYSNCNAMQMLGFQIVLIY